MPQASQELVRALAEANGLKIPEERLELVLTQYESFLRSLNEINSLPLAMESEPAFIFALPSQAATGRAGDREN